MTNIFTLRKRYHVQISRSFSKQDPFTVEKSIARSKRVLPRGRAYHRLMELEVNKK